MKQYTVAYESYPEESGWVDYLNVYTLEDGTYTLYGSVPCYASKATNDGIPDLYPLGNVGTVIRDLEKSGYIRKY